MSSSVARPLRALAEKVWFGDHMVYVRLLNGREVSVPLEWFPALLWATERQPNNWRLIGKSPEIYPPDLDEDLSISGLLEG